MRTALFILYVDGAVAYTGDAGANGIPNPSYPVTKRKIMGVAGAMVNGSFNSEGFNGAVANVSVAEYRAHAGRRFRAPTSTR